MVKYMFNWLTAAFVLLAVATFLIARLWVAPAEPSGPTAVHTVTRESFAVSITERGLIRPARISPIKSEISSNQAKIIWLMREGAQVKSGDVVARFDTKPFLDELASAEQDLADAKATLVAAQKLLLLQKEEEQGKIEGAERKLEIAQIDAQNIQEGSGPLERKQVEQKVKQAERAYRLAQANLNDMDMLLEKGHASLREREKAADAFATAREQRNVAREELKNFDQYKWPKMIREAELLVNGAESELQRVRRTAELQIQTRKGQVEKSRRNVENRGIVLNQAKRDLENCTIKAPTDGILLYSQVPRERGKRKLQIGDSVWVGQTFLEVPDTSELVVEIQIREIDVAKIDEGMEATVELDALPGKSFSGVVETVASLAETESESSNIRRFYARIKLLETAENIHVGMSASVRIIHRRITRQIAVPAGMVIYRDGTPHIYKRAGSAAELVPLTLGARGVEWVEVVDGLQEGDRVQGGLVDGG